LKSAETLNRGEIRRLFAEEGLLRAVMPKPEISMRLNDEGYVAVATVTKKDLLLGWEDNI